MEEKVVPKITLTRKEAEEYCAYKRQKKIAEIMEALRRSESELTPNDSAVKLGEQALRLRQAAVKMTPREMISRGEGIRKLGIKVDCIVGGNGETFASVKAFEAKKAIKEGAGEITLILTPSLIANCRYTELRKEIKEVRKATKRTLLKARVERNYPQATLERLIRICTELGVEYFSLPYFIGCERLQPSFAKGCLLEISGVNSLALFKEMARAGMRRMIVKGAWELYAEWLKEVELITPMEEEQKPFPPPIAGQKTEEVKNISASLAASERAVNA
jgi:deoxyribose-phosphate aldolase